jgi:hypothetical protein
MYSVSGAQRGAKGSRHKVVWAIGQVDYGDSDDSSRSFTTSCAKINAGFVS